MSPHPWLLTVTFPEKSGPPPPLLSSVVCVLHPHPLSPLPPISLSSLLSPFCKLHVKMADLTSVLTCVLFSSPSSKMFIGGLSWQTSPGKQAPVTPLFPGSLFHVFSLCSFFSSPTSHFSLLSLLRLFIYFFSPSPLFDPYRYLGLFGHGMDGGWVVFCF